MIGTKYASLLPQIADWLEAQLRTIVANGHSYDAAKQKEWQDAIALAAKRTISTSSDLIALARICRCARDGASGTPAELSDKLALKLQTAVITLLDPVAEGDVELLALHDRFMALEYQGRKVSQVFSDDDNDAGDATRELLIRQQNDIICQCRNINPATLEGHQAVARMLLVWTPHLKPSNDDSDSGEDQLLWLLLRSLVGVKQATELTGDEPNAVVQLIDIVTKQAGFSTGFDVADYPNSVIRMN